MAMGVTITSITAMTQFLSYHPPSSIPWLMVISGAVSVGTAMGGRLRSPGRSSSLLPASMVFALLAGAAAFWLAVTRPSGHPALPALSAPRLFDVIFSFCFGVFAQVAKIVLYTLVDYHISSQLNIREIKRLGGYFQNAILLGCIIGGGIYPWAMSIGFAPLIAVSAALVPAGAWVIRRPLGLLPPPEIGEPGPALSVVEGPAPAPRSLPQTLRFFYRSPFFSLIIAALTMYRGYDAIIWFKFYEGIRQAFPGKEALALFLSLFEMAVNGFTLIWQTALTGRILENLRVREQLLFTPLAVILSCAAWLWTGSVWALAAGFGAITLLQRGILFPARQTWGALIPPAFRKPGIGFLNGIHFPVLGAVMGLFLAAAGSRISSGVLLTAALVLAILQILIQTPLNWAYVLAVIKNLRLHPADGFPPAYYVSGRRTRMKILERLSRHHHPRLQNTIVEELTRFPSAATLNILLRCLKRTQNDLSDAVGMEAAARGVSRVAHTINRPDVMEDLIRCTRRAPMRVRLNLVDSLVQWERSDFIPQLKEICLMSEPPVARKAYYGLFLLARTKAELFAILEMLRADLFSGDWRRRACATGAMGEVGHRIFAGSIQEKLSDAEPLVRSQALYALRKLALPDSSRVLNRYKETETLPNLRRQAARTALVIDDIHKTDLEIVVAGLSSEERQRILLLASTGAYPASLLAALPALEPDSLRRRFIRALPPDPPPSFPCSLQRWLRPFRRTGEEPCFQLDTGEMLRTALAGAPGLRSAAACLALDLRDFLEKETFLRTAERLCAAISGARAPALQSPERAREIRRGLINKLLELIGLYCRDPDTFRGLFPILTGEDTYAAAHGVELIQQRLDDMELETVVARSIDLLAGDCRPGETTPEEAASLAGFGADLLTAEETAVLNKLSR